MTVTSAEKSTIVRIDSSLAVRGVQAVFAGLERVSPPAGARLALRLWCRVPRPPRRVSPRRSGPARARLTVGSGAVAVDVRGTGPTVYLLHGWGGWREQLAPLGT